MVVIDCGRWTAVSPGEEETNAGIASVTPIAKNGLVGQARVHAMRTHEPETETETAPVWNSRRGTRQHASKGSRRRPSVPLDEWRKKSQVGRLDFAKIRLNLVGASSLRCC